MAIYGYAGVATSAQDLTLQEDALKKAGCETIRAEKISETSVDGRQELNTLLEFLSDGDTLIVTRVDRITRSILEFQNIVNDLKGKGVSLKSLSGAGGFGSDSV